MKKPIIKNWIKYFAGTLAVSGMLAVGGCDTNERQTADNDYENQVEASETEPGDPNRENVRQEFDAENAEDTVAYETGTDQTDQSGEPQYEQMSETGSEASGTATSTPRAAQINDLGEHLEEHEEANKKVTETLTEKELKEAEAPGIYEGDKVPVDQQNGAQQGTTNQQGQQEGVDNQQGQQGTTNQQGQQEGVDNQQGQQGTTNQQGQQGTEEEQQQGYNTQPGQQDQAGDPTQQNNRMDQNEPANIGNQGTNTQQRQQGTEQQRTGGVPEEGNTQQGQVEYETDRQGTTEMEIDRQNQTNDTQQGQQEQGQQGTETDQGTNYRQEPIMQEGQQGEDVSRQGGTNVQGQEGADIYQNQQGTEGTNQDQQQGTTTEQGTPAQQDQGTNMQQGAEQQEDESAGMIIYERYSVVYPEDSYSEEDRQRMEDIMGEYEGRREAMRGQMDEETGAYSSPEVDPQPNEGYDQLMDQIQENITYPQNAQAAEIEGTVFVNFIIDEQGNIKKAKAVDDVIVPASSRASADPLNPTTFSEEEIKEAREEMHKEAVKAVEETSGQWEPGQQGGEQVKSEVQIPVRFNLADAGMR